MSDVDELDELGLFRRRFRQLTESQVRDREKVEEASERIDEISSQVGEVSLSDKVKEWRKKRYASGA